MNKEKIFIIAGEDSGDLHGAKLMKEIKEVRPGTTFFGIGGNRMKSEGIQLTEHINQLNVIGFLEVLKNYKKIKKIFDKTLLDIKKLNPDKIILIDYPGFNLRLAKKLSKLNFHITYFILPQVWAWKESRLKTLKNNCDRLIGIIPFEKPWYKERDVKIHYAGHPLSELNKNYYEKNSFYKKHNIPKDNKLIALLPGSRKSEIQKHWPIFKKTIASLQAQNNRLTFLLIEGQNVEINCDKEIIKIKDNQYEAISCSDVAIVCSGTATLEVAMLKCPMLVCYKTSSITWLLVQLLSKVKYVSLVNLIAEEKIVDEFLQKNMNAKNLSSGVLSLLDPAVSKKMKEKYNMLINILDNNKNVYKEAAKYIYA